MRRVGYVIVLMAIMLLFTVASRFSYIAWGGVAPYILASVVLLTDFKLSRYEFNVKVDKCLIKTILFINIVISLLGFGILTEQSFLIELIQRYYQSLGEELYEQMVVWNSKPVTVFGSHSTAALAYFCFFALNFKLSRNINLSSFWRTVYFLFALGFLILNWLLASNTAVAMTVLAVLFFLIAPIRKLSNKSKFLFFIFGLAFFLVVVFDSSLFYSLFGESDANGFLGRYSSGGRLQSTYDYLINNSFIPIGFSHSPEIGLGDNFIAEYIVKASPFGYAIILFLLWTWFNRHLNKYRAIAFFGFIVLADFAYPLLVYSRIAAVLPFYVLIWQRIDSSVFLVRQSDDQIH